MTEKEMRKLGRQDLLILLAEQTARADRLEEKLKEAEEKLNDRSITINKCGSMAEASLKLNDVFGSADKAVAQYLSSIKELEKDSKEKAALMVKKAELLLRMAHSKADEIVAQAKIEAEEILRQAQTQAKPTINTEIISPSTDSSQKKTSKFGIGARKKRGE